MFDAKANARAIERVKNKNQERMRRAYTYMMTTEDGRAFIHDLAETCHLYGRTRGLLDEGQRQIALGIRDQVIELGLFGQWQRAEREAEEYKKEVKNMLHQTEARDDEEI